MARAAIIPQSPPKRATRGRVKGATTTKAVSKPALKTAKSKTATSTTETRSRNIRAVSRSTNAPLESETDEETEDEIGVIESKTKGKPANSKAKSPTASASTRLGRGRKAPVADKESESESDDDELARSGAPKKRAGRPRTKTQTMEEESAKSGPAPKSRGRPKGTTKSTNPANILRENTRKNTCLDDSEQFSSSYQGPKEVHITTNATAARSNMLRGPAKKKKVTFQDLSESEDEEDLMTEPVPTAGRRKRSTAVTKDPAGLAAKPVRKPATPSTRGRKAATSKTDGTKPLSPKKATQVAKVISSYASSDGEEDELSGAKDNIKLVVHSPQKRVLETTGLSSPVRRINFTPGKPSRSLDENGEPYIQPPKSFDFSESLFMSSPARRPPPSPFHFTLRETPKRGRLSFHDETKPLSQPNFTPSQNSPLKASPKKAHLETPRRENLFLPEGTGAPSQQNFSLSEDSPLKSSARRGIFGTSISSQPCGPQSSTPFKSSLLQSPAKKVASPFKSSIIRRRPSIIEQPKLEEEDVDGASAAENIETTPLTLEDLDEEMEVDSAEEDQARKAQSEDDDDDDAEAFKHDMFSGDGEDYLEDYTARIDTFHEPASPMGYDEQDNITNPDLRDNQEDIPDEDEVTMAEAQDLTHNEAQLEQHLEDNLERIEGDQDEQSINGSLDGFGSEAGDDQEDERYENLISDSPHSITPENPETPEEHDSLCDQEQENEINQKFRQDPYLEDEYEQADVALRNSLLDGIEGLEDVFIDNPTEVAMIDVESVAETTNQVGGEDSINSPIGSVHDESQPDQYSDFDNHTVQNYEITQRYPLSFEPIQPYEIEEPESIACEYYFLRNVSTISPARVIGPELDMENDREDGMDPHSPSDLPVEAHNQGPETLGGPLLSPVRDTPSPPRDEAPQPQSTTVKGPRFTLLAEQLSQWKASTPEKSQPRRSQRRGVFSLAGRPSLPRHHDSEVSTTPLALPTRGSLEFAEENLGTNNVNIYEDQEQCPVAEENIEQVLQSPRLPMSEIFSDPHSTAPEAVVVGDKTMQTFASADHSACKSSEEEKENNAYLKFVPMTPMKAQRNPPPQTVHTVSKVPLKPEGQISPLKSRKRGRSLSMTSPVRSSPRLHKRVASSKVGEVTNISPRKSPRAPRPSIQPTPEKHSESKSVERLQAQRSRTPSCSSSPSKTRGKSPAAPPPCLRGAVVYVDVHTTEGEDASGIFIELLQQMGARCIKNWSWNPSSSLSPVEGVDPKEGKVGITHVVYKDGGVRTLEKVRHAAGLVKCVGVGWVLDCERENKWLDESHYAVDSSIIPRGGAKRRKSMEPRALSNINGTLIKTDLGASLSKRRSGTVETIRRNTPPIPRDTSSSATPESTSTPRKYQSGHIEGDQKFWQTPKTPGSTVYNFNLDSIGMSPATPFYLSQRSKLVQQTCPPKQTRQGLFSSKVGSPGDPSHKLKDKLEAARRKSLAFKPAIGSRLVE